MKNIHILPTNKPNRLYSYYGILEDLSYGKTFTIVNEEIAKINLHKDLKDYQEKLIKNGWVAENIYITSDEEIKEGDWLLIIDDFETYVHKHKGDNLPTTYHKKIILTTDQDLINDGIQLINDEFLEWFVKNPSCESVEVIIEYKDGYGNWYKYDKEFWDKHGNKPKFGTRYKIIIPKEEPKQEIVGYGLHLFMKRYNE